MSRLWDVYASVRLRARAIVPSSYLDTIVSHPEIPGKGPEVDEAETLHFKRAKLVRDSLGVWCTSVNRAVLFSRRLKNSTR